MSLKKAEESDQQDDGTKQNELTWRPNFKRSAFAGHIDSRRDGDDRVDRNVGVDDLSNPSHRVLGQGRLDLRAVDAMGTAFSVSRIGLRGMVLSRRLIAA